MKTSVITNYLVTFEIVAFNWWNHIPLTLLYNTRRSFFFIYKIMSYHIYKCTKQVQSVNNIALVQLHFVVKNSRKILCTLYVIIQEHTDNALTNRYNYYDLSSYFTCMFYNKCTGFHCVTRFPVVYDVTCWALLLFDVLFQNNPKQNKIM